MTVQYGEGWFDHSHVELTPVSTASVGLYIPLPGTEKLALVSWSRGRGLDLDVREVDE
jgi:hypothetical protein